MKNEIVSLMSRISNAIFMCSSLPIRQTIARMNIYYSLWDDFEILYCSAKFQRFKVSKKISFWGRKQKSKKLVNAEIRSCMSERVKKLQIYFEFGDCNFSTYFLSFSRMMIMNRDLIANAKLEQNGPRELLRHKLDEKSR